MFFRRKFSRRGARRFGRRPSRMPRKKVSKVVRRYVKKALHTQIENKEIVNYANNDSITTGTAGTAPTNYGLIPSVAQGTATNQRVGDNIRIRSGVFKGQLHIKDYNATTNPYSGPVWVKIFLVRLLSTNTQLSSIASADYFFKGNGTALPFQGNPMDLDFAINDQKFRLITTKTVKLGNTYWTSTTPMPQNGYGDNSSYCKRFSINWGKYCKKLLKYSEEDANVCTNDNLYLLFQPVYASGMGAGGKQLVQLTYVSHIKYEDA